MKNQLLQHIHSSYLLCYLIIIIVVNLQLIIGLINCLYFVVHLKLKDYFITLVHFN